MKRSEFRWAVALAVMVPAWLSAVPASAQGQAQARPGSDGGSVSTPHSGGGSSGGSSSGGSQPSSGSGGSSSGGYSSGGDAGRRSGATGGGGYAVPRGERSGSSGGRASGGGSGTATVGGRSGARDGSDTAGTTSPPGDNGVPAYARPSEGHRPIGTAVPRGSVPPANPGGGGIVVPGGYYPGGYYDPWGYGYGGYGYGYGGGYGGYYGGYYDPWYGGYPSSPQASYTSSDEGAVRLKVKPRDAEVYVDGFFVGSVDDFDGVFQRLHVDSGAHRIEVRKAGYEPLSFDVRVNPDHTTTYQGDLIKIQ